MFPTRFIDSALKKSRDAAAQTIDVKAFVGAANAAFPPRSARSSSPGSSS
jgi:hypothetical protein